YDFKDTDLRTNEKIKSLKVIEKGPLKIGILGVGIDPEGLMLKKNIQGLKYLDPIENANKTAAYLKKEKKCDYVICLSHLGYSYKENKVSDMILAKNSENIDLIIGGHTHTFLKKPVEVLNKNGKSVLVNQVGWAGVWMGHLTIYFDSHRKIFFQNNLNFKIS
ncbi:MAG: metallophosphoesterase, partial [Bacteroidia bacterium]